MNWNTVREVKYLGMRHRKALVSQVGLGVKDDKN